ncbi:MAG: transglutaminase family protein [Anaerolineae bacterium]
MYFSIRHITIFNYSTPVSQSVMEVRKQPRTEGIQQCISFKLLVQPHAQVMGYRDYQGNIVHHFDIPKHHNQLTITAESYVEMEQPLLLPETLGDNAWEHIDNQPKSAELWDCLMPSQFVRETPLLRELAQELRVERRGDPLHLLHEINSAIYEHFDYEPKSTNVDSPIDDALTSRKGVCQDFAHIMLALLRPLGIPCRYISGYLARYSDDHARSAPDASHAWIEAHLPGLGWVGFDPTNNQIAGQYHIRVAAGRDYADVPPTRGVYKGNGVNELKVAVQVRHSDELPPHDELVTSSQWIVYSAPPETSLNQRRIQEQQQQQ